MGHGGRERLGAAGRVGPRLGPEHDVIRRVDAQRARLGAAPVVAELARAREEAPRVLAAARVHVLVELRRARAERGSRVGRAVDGHDQPGARLLARRARALQLLRPEARLPAHERQVLLAPARVLEVARLARVAQRRHRLLVRGEAPRDHRARGPLPRRHRVVAVGDAQRAPVELRPGHGRRARAAQDQRQDRRASWEASIPGAGIREVRAGSALLALEGRHVPVVVEVRERVLRRRSRTRGPRLRRRDAPGSSAPRACGPRGRGPGGARSGAGALSSVGRMLEGASDRGCARRDGLRDASDSALRAASRRRARAPPRRSPSR